MRLTDEDINLGRFCIAEALELGAGQVRITISKSVADTYSMRDGELDGVNHSADSGISIEVFTDGRKGSFSTNRLDKASLKTFLKNAIASTRLLARDADYRLPDPGRCVKNAVEGTEMGLFDENYYSMTDRKRLEIAKATSLPPDKLEGAGWRLVSYECEYTDSVSDSLTLDSQGLFARGSETSFLLSCDLTIEDGDGNKYNSNHWDGDSFLCKLCSPDECSETALRNAVAQMHPLKVRGGRRKMVVDRRVASKLVAPVINALYDSSLFRKASFLADKQGQKVFSDNFTLVDRPHAKGLPGARLFDSEGVATEDRTIIGKGVVENYFVSTYYSPKLNIPPTIGSPSVPTILPCAPAGIETSGNWNRDAIIRAVGEGILVTGFNGGNYNEASGDFSYGIEGFLIKNGKLDRPVREMLITGNFLELWSGLLAAGNDPRTCTRWQLPTLAFDAVSFSA